MPIRPSLLAIEGGRPAFDEPLHVGRPNLPPRDAFLRRVDELLDRVWLTNGGPMVRAFEDHVAELTGARNCVAVTSGTQGIQALLRTLGVWRPVAMPSFTFVATAAAAAWLGIDPYLLDIEPAGFGLDPSLLASIAPDDVGAIVAVHTWGHPCSPEAIHAAAPRRCPVIFDAAHALGCSLDGRSVGTFGTAEVFSFHATKVVNTFEGGAITTNDDALAADLRRAINFGFVSHDSVEGVGTNAKLDEVRAAMGLALLDHLPHILECNDRNRRAYQVRLREIEGIDLVRPPYGVVTNGHYLVAMVDEDRFGLSRDELYRFLHTEHVLVRRYFHPGLHRLAPYARFGGARTFPNTEHVAQRCLALPTGTSMSKGQVHRVVDLIETASDKSHSIRRLLASMPWP